MDSNENFFQEISEKEIQKPKQTKKPPKDNYFQNLVSQKIPFASKQSFRFNTSVTSFSDLWILNYFLKIDFPSEKSLMQLLLQ